MKIHIQGRESIDVGGSEVELEGCYCGVGIKTDQGLFGIAQRDGGLEILLDGKPFAGTPAGRVRRDIAAMEALRGSADAYEVFRDASGWWARPVGKSEPLGFADDPADAILQALEPHPKTKTCVEGDDTARIPLDGEA